MTKHERVAMTLRRNIGGALGTRGWTQTRAAREMEMDPAALGDRVRGRRPFRVHELVRLAAVLDIEVWELLKGIEDSSEYIEWHVKGRRLRVEDEIAEDRDR